MSARYRAAVVGCGRIGLAWERAAEPQPKPATHAGAWAAQAGVELAAVVDVKPEALELAGGLFPAVPAFTDHREMLVAVRPAIVSVATQPDTHAEIVAACAWAGVRAVVCEKPIADAPGPARRMIEACAQAGTLLFVNHTRRFDPEIRRARDEVTAGVVGPVLQASAYYTNGLVNTGTHIVDLLRFFLGDAAWVTAVANTRGAAPPGDLGVDALIEFASGARAALQFLDVRDYSVFDVHFYGRRGVLALTRFGYEVERTRLRPRPDVAGLLELDLDGRTRKGRPRSLMSSLARHVVACLDGRESPESRGEDGLAALELLHALRASAAAGGVRLPVPAGTLGESHGE